jgi:hypothetical protein
MTEEAPKYVIPWDTKLTDFDGTEIRDSVAQESNPTKQAPPLTLGAACRHALTIIQPGDDTKPTVKFERGCLAYDIYKGDVPSLEAEKITELKELVGKLYGPVVVRQVYFLLDPSTKRK